jgi:surface polysaccharide O-acyltransferase-like enzyme
MAVPATPIVDPLATPPENNSFPAPPLLRDEHAPLRPSLLDFNPTTRRMENLDSLRILCMLVIIVTHVTEPYIDHAQGDSGGLYQSVFSINVAARFGVPCFMMISFFIYWHQLYDKGRSWGELLLRRFKRLIPAFLCWSLAYVAIHKALKKLTGDAQTDALAWIYNMDLTRPAFWKQILLLGRAETHLYYLPMVMTCLLMIPILRVLWRRPAVAWTFVAATLLAWVIVYYGSCIWPPDTPIGRPIHRVFVFWQDVVAIPLLVFPLLGMMCAGQQPWRRFIAHTPAWLWIGVLVAGLALHVVETLILLDSANRAPTEAMQNHRWLVALAGLKPGRLVSAVAIFVLFIRSPLMKDPFPRVSHYAFGLHFMHPMIILALSLVEARLLAPAVASWQAWIVPMLLINFALTFVITFGLCLLIGRFKRLEFLVV